MGIIEKVARRSILKELIKNPDDFVLTMSVVNNEEVSIRIKKKGE